MKPGSVIIVNFPGATGIKRRPAIVVSTAIYHAERPDLILAPVTTQVAKASAKTDCILQDWSFAALKQPSAARMFLGTKPKTDVTKIGELSDRDWAEVQKRLRISLEV
jgi:mRNA interferase MazF